MIIFTDKEAYFRALCLRTSMHMVAFEFCGEGINYELQIEDPARILVLSNLKSPRKAIYP